MLRVFVQLFLLFECSSLYTESGKKGVASLIQVSIKNVYKHVPKSTERSNHNSALRTLVLGEKKQRVLYFSLSIGVSALLWKYAPCYHMGFSLQVCFEFKTHV